MRAKSEIMWAITGEWRESKRRFFYYGTYRTRQAAIQDHIGEHQTWRQCRAIGDRAVRVRIEEV